MNTTPATGIIKAIACFRTLQAFCDALDVPYKRVQGWVRNGVPAQYCPEIEKLTGVQCEELNDRVDWAYVRANKRTKPRAIAPRA